jgi:hypothetical protein
LQQAPQRRDDPAHNPHAGATAQQIRHQLVDLLAGDLVDRTLAQHRREPQAHIDLDQGVRSKHAGARTQPPLGEGVQGQGRRRIGRGGWNDWPPGGLQASPLGARLGDRAAHGHRAGESGTRLGYQDLIGASAPAAGALVARGRTGDPVESIHPRLDALAPAAAGAGRGAAGVHSLRLGGGHRGVLLRRSRGGPW